MSILVDGQSCVPPGFRFHPTEEELLSYYLRKKVTAEEINLDVIREVDLNKLEPWDIQEKCRIASTPQTDWYFFSHKDKKYPTGTRTNRATAAGFWKATGRDKVINSTCRRIGMRKTLVFYKGRAPHGQKSDWIMHEYRLDDHSAVNLVPQSDIISSPTDAANQEDGWVVCRVFKKNNFHCKAMNIHSNFSSMMHNNKTQLLHSAIDEGLDQILQCLGRSCKEESRAIDANCNTNAAHVQEKLQRLPSLDSPTYTQLPPCGYHTSYVPEPIHAAISHQSDPAAGVADWAAFDRLLVSQLDVQSTEPTTVQVQCFDDHVFSFCSSDEYKLISDDGNPWSLTRSACSASTDPMGQVSM